MSWLAVSIIPKRTVIVHREKEEREREESRGGDDGSNEGGRVCYLTHQQVSWIRTKLFPIISIHLSFS